MDELFEKLNAVDNPASFVEFLDELRNEISKHKSEKYSSVNTELDGFLECAGAWVTDARPNMIEELIDEPNKWSAIAQILYVGFIYE